MLPRNDLNEPVQVMLWILLYNIGHQPGLQGVFILARICLHVLWPCCTSWMFLDQLGIQYPEVQIMISSRWRWITSSWTSHDMVSVLQGFVDIKSNDPSCLAWPSCFDKLKFPNSHPRGNPGRSAYSQIWLYIVIVWGRECLLFNYCISNICVYIYT